MPQTLEVLYNQYHKLVFSTACRITGNASDAEDVLHTVFLRLLKRNEPGAIEHSESYLRRSAANAALDVVRARREAANPDFERMPAKGLDMERSDLPEHLRRALATLPARSAEMFVLRFFEGMSNPEIAQAMGLSQMVVAVTLHRARRKLQKELADWK